MIKALRIVGLLAVASCLIHLVLARGPQPSIGATLSRNAESVVEWNPCTPGKYFLSIVYKADVLPQDVRDNFFNPQHPPHIKWEADLILATENGDVFSTNNLNLEPSGWSGKDAYFMVGQIDLKRQADLEIRLTPREPAPFGANPSIELRPSGKYYEYFIIGNYFWFAAYLACIPIGILLLIDLKRQMRRKVK